MTRAVFSAIRPALARVICSDIDSAGSAFVVHEEGYLVTANHVISKIELQNGAIVSNYSTDISIELGGVTYAATIANDQTNPAPLVFDYSILKIDTDLQLTKLEIAPYADAFQGDDLLCAGYPLNFGELVVSKGIVSALVRHPSILNSLQMIDSIVTDSLMQFGSSGGPLIMVETSRVIGINTRKHSQSDAHSTLYEYVTNALPEDNVLRRLVECTYQYRHLGFHHANSMQYVMRDPAYPQ